MEDDKVQGQVLVEWLTSTGHTAELYSDGQRLVGDLPRRNFDLLLLDWQVPGLDGAEVLRWVRSSGGTPVPVIFVTAFDAEEAIVSVLNQGADDYMVKPVRRHELLARVDAVIRRYRAMMPTAQVLSVGAYRIDPNVRRVWLHDNPVELTDKEFQLAWYLFRHVGRLLTRTQILESVWGWNDSVQSRTMDTHMSRLRRKLELKPDNGVRLVSVYSYGYRLEIATNDATSAGGGTGERSNEPKMTVSTGGGE